MKLVHLQGVQVRGVAGDEAEAGEEVDVDEEGELHKQQQTLHGLLWTVSCKMDLNMA